MGILLYYTNNFDALFDIFQKTLDFFRFVYYNAMSELNLIVFRGVAQLVARLLWEQDAGGSSPFTPTIK